MSFTEPKANCDVFGLFKDVVGPGVVDTMRTTARVEWEFGMEARDYGIKSFDTSIQRVTCEIEWQIDVQLGGEEIEKLKEYGGIHLPYRGVIDGEVSVNSTIPFNGKEWKVINSLYISDGQSCFVSNVDIDFENMTIEVM